MPFAIEVAEDKTAQYFPKRRKYYQITSTDYQANDLTEDQVFLTSKVAARSHMVIMHDLRTESYFMLQVSYGALLVERDPEYNPKLMFGNNFKPIYSDLSCQKDGIGFQKESVLSIVVITNESKKDPKELAKRQKLIETLLKRKITAKIQSINFINSGVYEYTGNYSIVFNPQNNFLKIISGNQWYFESYSDAFQNNKNDHAPFLLSDAEKKEFQSKITAIISRVEFPVVNNQFRSTPISDTILRFSPEMAAALKSENVVKLLQELEGLIKEKEYLVLDLGLENTINVLNLLGYFYCAREEYSIAGLYFENGGKIVHNDGRRTSFHYVLAAAAYERDNHYQLAYEFYKQSLQRLYDDEADIERFNIALDLGRVALLIGKDKEALQFLELIDAEFRVPFEAYKKEPNSVNANLSNNDGEDKLKILEEKLAESEKLIDALKNNCAEEVDQNYQCRIS